MRRDYLGTARFYSFLETSRLALCNITRNSLLFANAPSQTCRRPPSQYNRISLPPCPTDSGQNIPHVTHRIQQTLDVLDAVAWGLLHACRRDTPGGL